tara:strand:- start:54 stop:374 length:321 start_codon:yes stop_codon:yes gene_type:complete
MKTVSITIGNDRGQPTGTEIRRARKTPIPGLVITGERGVYNLTHVQSGRKMPASVYNYNATLEQIRNAAFLATTVHMIDWTVDHGQLARDKCRDWYRAFGGALAHM